MKSAVDELRGALDGSGLLVLDRDQCLRLAGQATLGRLGVTNRALPMILPVTYGLVDGAPVLRIGSGMLRTAAAQSSVCCFEVDAADPAWSWAWSVAMIGELTMIADPALVARARTLGLPAWPPSATASSDFARIEPAIVSGRLYGDVPSLGSIGGGGAPTRGRR